MKLKALTQYFEDTKEVEFIIPKEGSLSYFCYFNLKSVINSINPTLTPTFENSIICLSDYYNSIYPKYGYLSDILHLCDIVRSLLLYNDEKSEFYEFMNFHAEKNQVDLIQLVLIDSNWDKLLFSRDTHLRVFIIIKIIIGCYPIEYQSYKKCLYEKMQETIINTYLGRKLSLFEISFLLYIMR